MIYHFASLQNTRKILCKKASEGRSEALQEVVVNQFELRASADVVHPLCGKVQASLLGCLCVCLIWACPKDLAGVVRAVWLKCPAAFSLWLFSVAELVA